MPATTRDDLFETIHRSDGFLARHQGADGAWRVAPEPRVLENALTLLLCRALLAPGAVRAAEAVLASVAPQAHSELAAAVDTFLLARCRGDASTLAMTSAEWREPAMRHRQVFFAGLGHAYGWPMHGAPDRAALVAGLWAAVRARDEREMKRWTVAECSALLVLLGERDAELIDGLVAAQDRGGSFGHNPLSTALAVAALAAGPADAGGRAGDALRAGVRALEHAIEAHGSWRFATAEVWDTALVLRALVERRWQVAPGAPAATAFLLAAQNADGGWPYRVGVESDTDTTGLATYAVRAHRRATASAAAYLEARRTEAGLWRTWHDSEDPPAEDAVAHAVVALAAVGRDDLCAPARRWLAERFDVRRGWTAHWYNSDAYAAAEIGAALGHRHPLTRRACGLLLERQHADGGWAPRVGAVSTAAATGMALALLAEHAPWSDSRVQAGVAFLAGQQAADGRFTGATDMYAPRPFAVDYAMQTHALALTGLTRWGNRLAAEDAAPAAEAAEGSR